jgi:phenylpropionate dioxygenase-like ring-hydroxylating dioxygenase large terminal subunit
MAVVESRAESLIKDSKALLADGMVDRRMYSDPEIYQLELERVFTRTWLPIGHESQIPNPGDFFESYMGEESVIMCRNLNGEVKVLLNSCRHRGNKVCRAEMGNANTFLCQYHGWTFDTDGKFAGAPRFEELYAGHFEKDKWGLIQARVESYKGLVFATWDYELMGLVDYLGDFTWIMDMMLDRHEGGVEVAGGQCFRWKIPMNWKFGAENSAGDCYHGTTHKSAIDVKHGATSIIGASAKAREAQDERRGMTIVSPMGHGANCTVLSPDGTDIERPEPKTDTALGRYYADHLDEAIERLGEYRALNVVRYNMNVFPTCGLHTSAQSMHILFPKGPRETEVWLFPFVPTDASKEAKLEVVREAGHHFGPAGLFEEDDGENWQQATASTTGVIQSRYPFNYQLAYSTERFLPKDASMPDRLAGLSNEYAQRAMMARWHDMMLEP